MTPRHWQQGLIQITRRLVQEYDQHGAGCQLFLRIRHNNKLSSLKIRTFNSSYFILAACTANCRVVTSHSSYTFWFLSSRSQTSSKNIFSKHALHSSQPWEMLASHRANLLSNFQHLLPSSPQPFLLNNCIRVNCFTIFPSFDLFRFVRQTVVAIVARPKYLESYFLYASTNINRHRGRGEWRQYVIAAHHLLTSLNGLRR